MSPGADGRLACVWVSVVWRACGKECEGARGLHKRAWVTASARRNGSDGEMSGSLLSVGWRGVRIGKFHDMGSGISTEPFVGKSLIQDFFMSGDQHGLDPDPHRPSHTPGGPSTSSQCLSSVADGAGVTSLALSICSAVLAAAHSSAHHRMDQASIMHAGAQVPRRPCYDSLPFPPVTGQDCCSWKAPAQSPSSSPRLTSSSNWHLSVGDPPNSPSGGETLK